MQEVVRVLQYHSTFLEEQPNEVWTTPRPSWWKVNCDVAWRVGVFAFAMVVSDDDGLLVLADTKLSPVSSVVEVELKAIEWAITFITSKPWNNLSFSSDVLVAVNEILTLRDPSGWHTSELVGVIRSMIRNK